jgi:hypothetical protein
MNEIRAESDYDKSSSDYKAIETYTKLHRSEHIWNKTLDLISLGYEPVYFRKKIKMEYRGWTKANDLQNKWLLQKRLQFAYQIGLLMTS